MASQNKKCKTWEEDQESSSGYSSSDDLPLTARLEQIKRQMKQELRGVLKDCDGSVKEICQRLTV